jgi:hypothetical protein
VNLVTPKPGGSDLFGISADVVRRLEHVALMLGAMVDIVREVTGCPHRELARANDRGVQSIDGLDPMSRARGRGNEHLLGRG